MATLAVRRRYDPANPARSTKSFERRLFPAIHRWRSGFHDSRPDARDDNKPPSRKIDYAAERNPDKYGAFTLGTAHNQ
jgi:hypothetical protein